MGRFMDIVKEHPWWIAGGVLGVVLLIWLTTRGGSSSAPGVVAYGPSDTVVTANAITESERIKANAATAQAQLALEAKYNDNLTAAAIVGSNNAAAVNINAANVKGATDIAAAQVAGAVAITGSNNATDLALQDGINKTAVQLGMIDANTELLQSLGKNGGKITVYNPLTGQRDSIGLLNISDGVMITGR